MVPSLSALARRLLNARGTYKPSKVSAGMLALSARYHLSGIHIGRVWDGDTAVGNGVVRVFRNGGATIA